MYVEWKLWVYLHFVLKISELAIIHTVTHVIMQPTLVNN